MHRWFLARRAARGLVLSALVSLLCAISPPGRAHADRVHTQFESGTALSDEKAIEHVMKAQFDKPQSPLKVSPVAVEGSYAVAGWIQDERGGRALLKKVQGKWMIQVCGGDGLKDAAALAMTGMSDAAARNLARKVRAAEAKLPAEQVRKFAMFEGMVKIDGGSHDAHGAHGAHGVHGVHGVHGAGSAHPAPAAHPAPPATAKQGTQEK